MKLDLGMKDLARRLRAAVWPEVKQLRDATSKPWLVDRQGAVILPSRRVVLKAKKP